jgi:hypothetical protein
MISFQQELSFPASVLFKFMILFAIISRDLFPQQFSFSKLKLNFHLMKAFAQSICLSLIKISIPVLIFGSIFYVHLIILKI